MYYVIEIQSTSETSGNFVWNFNAREDAEAKFHTVAAAAAKSAVLVHTVVLLTREGALIKSECYKHPEAGGNE